MKESKELQPNQDELKQKQEEAEEMRKRVDKLRETDNKYEDSMRTLAENEDKFREELEKELEKAGVKKGAIRNGVIGNLADTFSTKDLERIEAEKRGMIDALTGLRNRRAYETEIPGLLAIEKRDQKNCSILIIDFDHFKEVNEKYGYISGDVALRAIAAVLKESVKRESDAVYRVGGEEFVIFLPSADSEYAGDLAEKIRLEIEKMIIEIPNIDPKTGKPVPLERTVSVGVAGTDKLVKDWKKSNKEGVPDGFFRTMFNAANSAVTASKQNGRNRVTIFGEEPSKK